MSSSRLAQLAKFGIPILLLIWILSYMTSSREAYNTIVKTHFKSEKDKFVYEFLNSDVGGDFDGSGIAEACAQRTWTPGLILSCVPVDGGFGQVKNGHLNCIRFAMEMGAELVLPRIVQRDSKNIIITRPKNGKGPYVGEPLDYLFDYEHLNKTLQRTCPQMKVYRSMDDLWDVPQVSPPKKISLSAVEVHLTNGTVIEDMGKLKEQIKTYIEKAAPAETRRMPIRFDFEATNWAFPTAFDGPAFANNFGRLLRPRKDARLLAAVALYNLQKRYGVVGNPSRDIQNNKFAGIHLRTEADAAGKNGFPDYETQATNLLDFVRDAEARLVFVATGTTEKEKKLFANKAQEFNVTTVYKENLLEEEGLALLNEMTWDQRALVDYEIMLRAVNIAGPVESSFTWNLALERSLVPGASGEVSPVDGLFEHSDKYSTIIGRSARASALRATIWP
ncbi:hypothetical protein QBC38DRAFT_471570 [Podospora fimiseda]|uniref:Alternative oxidase n=1 Tax=Podospora fimiseda TaxID=252190 RepID=A0AAN7BU93_9PEZI|nr:hypothetical protein QBC38DRAFT_471570 [Podospora fimiseda]